MDFLSKDNKLISSLVMLYVSNSNAIGVCVCLCSHQQW